MNKKSGNVWGPLYFVRCIFLSLRVPPERSEAFENLFCLTLTIVTLTLVTPTTVTLTIVSLTIAILTIVTLTMVTSQRAKNGAQILTQQSPGKDRIGEREARARFCY